MHLAAMSSLIGRFGPRVLTGFVLGTLFLAAYFFLPAWLMTVLLAGALVWVACFEWPIICPLQRPFCWLIAPIYPLFPFVLMIYLNEQAIYRPLLFFAFALAPSFDTGSYMVGKAVGRTSLCWISPDKTWEGFAGGVMAVLVTLIMLLWPDMRAVMVLTPLVSIVALAGDLFESWFKRRAGVKDAGALLPGHGGLLDRFDSIIAVVMLSYLMRGYLVPLLATTVIA